MGFSFADFACLRHARIAAVSLAALLILLAAFSSCSKSTAKSRGNLSVIQPIIANNEAAGAGAGGGNSGADSPGEFIPISPIESELYAKLLSEFERLGIDPARTASKAPAGSANAVFDLSARIIYDGGAGDSSGGAALAGETPIGVELDWTERLIGDYDQNGEVGIPDITPIALHYEQTAAYRPAGEAGGIAYWPTGDPDDSGGAPPNQPPAAGSGAENWRLARIDGDYNGEIGISDVTPIALHYLERLDGYRVYRKGPGDLSFTMLPNAGTPESPVTLTRDDAITGTGGDTARPVRYKLTDESATQPGAYFYKVSPYDLESAAEGKSSALAYVIIGVPLNYPPEWTEELPEPVTQGRDCRIIVGWPRAIDPNGDAVTYSIYYDDDPIPPADFPGTLEEWLARACEPVSSTFAPLYDADADVWRDMSKTPPEELAPDDRRMLALNPARLADNPELEITRDEIPLQVVTWLTDGERLNERDWAYVANQPGGFPPEPGTNKNWMRIGPVDNVTAIPDYISPTVLTYHDLMNEEDAIPASEPNLRERGRYHIAVVAVDDKGAMSEPIKTVKPVIASAFYIAQRFDIADGYKTSHFSLQKTNAGNIWAIYGYLREDGSGERAVRISKYNPDTRSFQSYEIDKVPVSAGISRDVVHEFPDGSILVHYSVWTGPTTYLQDRLVLVHNGNIVKSEDLQQVTGYPFVRQAFWISGQIVLLYGSMGGLSEPSWPLTMLRGDFGNWGVPEVIEEKVWDFTVGGVREDAVDIGIKVHKTELGDSTFETPNYIRAIRVTASGIEELYKNTEESGQMIPTFESYSVLYVTDEQMISEPQTYTAYHFFLASPRPPDLSEQHVFLESYSALRRTNWTGDTESIKEDGYMYQWVKHFLAGEVSVLEPHSKYRTAYFMGWKSSSIGLGGFLCDDSYNRISMFRDLHLDEPISYEEGRYLVLSTF